MVKKILTVLLLFSVALSLVWLVVKRVREASAEPSTDGGAALSVQDGVVANYCHGKERCENCRNYEAYAKEIIENDFAKPLSQGLLYWQVVDFDQPANKHFDADFELGGAATLILVRMEGGRQTESKVLRDGLMMVAMGEKDKLTEYVQSELGAFLAKQQTSRQETGGGYLFGLAWALWLGVFTSVTPCPLATNIAAVSYIGRRVGKTRQVLLTGLLYALGRTVVYLSLGALLVAGLLASATVSSFLRKHMNELLGPLLILVGLFLLEMVRVGLPGTGMTEKVQRRVDAMGIWGALLLGVVFALAFCPISAGLFFFQLVPQSAYLGSYVGLPALYGIGTAIPVVAFTLVLVYSAQSVGKVFNRVTQIEWWVRRIGGFVFLALGAYFTLVYVFGVAG